MWFGTVLYIRCKHSKESHQPIYKSCHLWLLINSTKKFSRCHHCYHIVRGIGKVGSRGRRLAETLVFLIVRLVPAEPVHHYAIVATSN